MMMVCRIDGEHFQEVMPHAEKAYPYFIQSIRKIFRNPDMTQAKLMELSEVKQHRDEDHQAYMDRIRTLVIKTYPKMSMDDRDKLMTTHFVSGLHNQQIAIQLSGKVGLTPAKAVNKAAAIAAFLHDVPRSRKPEREKKSDFVAVAAAERSSRQYSRPGSADSSQSDIDPAAREHPARSHSEAGSSHGESEDEFFGAMEGRPPYARRFKPSATSGRCFRCGRYGHRRAQCRVPESDIGTNRERTHDPPTAKGTGRCPMCEGTHFMERCPELAKASGILADMRQQNRTPFAGVPAERQFDPAAERPSQSDSFKQPRAPPLPGNPKSQQLGRPPEKAMVGFEDHFYCLPSLTSSRDLTRDRDKLERRDMSVELALPGVSDLAHAELFFVAVQFQNKWTWALVDTGSSRNLLSLAFYHQLLYQPPLRPPREFKVLAGNGQPLDLSGLGNLRSVVERILVLPRLRHSRRSAS